MFQTEGWGSYRKWGTTAYSTIACEIYDTPYDTCKTHLVFLYRATRQMEYPVCTYIDVLHMCIERIAMRTRLQWVSVSLIIHQRAM